LPGTTCPLGGGGATSRGHARIIKLERTDIGISGHASRDAEAPSFRDISRLYSKREQLLHFAAEAAFFGVLGLMAAQSLWICAATWLHYLAAT
jgi:hypothetical protein